MLRDSARLLPVTDLHCRRAVELVERSALRAGDALHLAIAEASDAVVVTLDRRMAEAGQALGLGTILLS